jgi:hypothetical protein
MSPDAFCGVAFLRKNLETSGIAIDAICGNNPLCRAKVPIIFSMILVTFGN